MKHLNFRPSKARNRSSEHKTAAFTLIEVMTAALLASIVAGGTGSILVGMQKSNLRNMAYIDLQRSADHVFHFSDSAIRSSTPTNTFIIADNQLIIDQPDPIILKQDGANMIVDNDPTTAGEGTLICGTLKSLEFKKLFSPPAIRVSMELEDSKYPEISLKSTYDIAWRNQ